MNTTKLQHIPKYQLLEKLEQGWSVRRKAWADPDFYICQKNNSITDVTISHLLKDDWEGYPPAPTLKLYQKKLNFESALWIVDRQETVFLRHSKWKSTQYIGWNDNKLAFFDECLNVFETNIDIRPNWFDGPVWEVWVDVCDPKY